MKIKHFFGLAVSLFTKLMVLAMMIFGLTQQPLAVLLTMQQLYAS